MSNISELYMKQDIVWRYKLKITNIKNYADISLGYKITIDKEIFRKMHNLYHERANGIKALVKHICYQQYGEEIFEYLYYSMPSFHNIVLEIHNNYKNGIIAKGCALFSDENKCRLVAKYIEDRLKQEVQKMRLKNEYS